MDDIIKSAREIAMEKVAALGEPTEEERLTWKNSPVGEKLAGGYLKDETNLLVELGKYGEKDRKYVAAAASEVLGRNIGLPRNDAVKKTNRRAMDGLKLLKKDKAGLENVFSKMRYLFNHYEQEGQQQRVQAYESLKAEMTVRIQQALQQQTGMPVNTNINVEQQPQFQQEWRKMQNQLDEAYMSHLNEYKSELAGIE